jgi:hypothetical protein
MILTFMVVVVIVAITFALIFISRGASEDRTFFRLLHGSHR